MKWELILAAIVYIPAVIFFFFEMKNKGDTNSLIKIHNSRWKYSCVNNLYIVLGLVSFTNKFNTQI